MKKILLVVAGWLCLCPGVSAEAEKKAEHFISGDYVSGIYRENHPQEGTDANLIGHVKDKATGEHLPYIYVTVKGTTISMMTDQTGHYFLKNLPVGEFTVEVAAMGYRTVSRKVVFKKGYTLELNFELEEDRIALDGVVVSANRSETTRRMAPTLVNVVTMDLYNQVNACKLSQGLNFQPGVRVENNCQNCGFQQIRINGLDGPYTQILIDSRPIFSALAGVYGTDQIPANMVDRVEVMRGGGSALFGSSAIAGTINIITKEPTRNSATLAHTLTNYDAKNSWENNTAINASLVTDDNKMGLAIFGQNREFTGYDTDGDGFTELAKISSQTLGFRSYIKTGLYSKITAEYHHLQEYRRGGDQLDIPPHEAQIAEEIKHGINTGGLKFDWFSKDERHRLNAFASVQDINRKSYYGLKMNPDAYGKTDNTTWMTGLQYIYKFNKCLFMPADLTAGVEFNQDFLHDVSKAYRKPIDQRVDIISAYLQNEWKNSKWGFLLGGRLDKHSMLKKPIFSPRANLRYNPIENINLRASYSFGFRAPQAFDEDMHVDNAGGDIYVIEFDRNTLRPEKSQSVSLSADMYGIWGDVQANLLVEGFYNDLKDVFILEEQQEPNEFGVMVRRRVNGKGARVFGGNLEGKIAWKDRIQLQAGMTFQSARYKEARQWSPDVEMTKKIFRTPDIYGYFTFSYNPLKDLMLALSGNYTGSMLVEHHAGFIEKDVTVKTPDFMEVNLKVSYDLKLYKGIRLQFNGGVQNIFDAYQNDFDQKVERDAAYIYGPMAPRCFFLGLKLSY